jgi:hypothetical protein
MIATATKTQIKAAIGSKMKSKIVGGIPGAASKIVRFIKFILRPFLS